MTVRSWMKLCVLWLAATGALPLATIPALAYDKIVDTKAWCGKLTDTIASGNMDAVGQMFEDGSRGAITAAGAGVDLGTIGAFIKTGPHTATSYLTEMDYGDAFRRQWYMIVIGRVPIFIRCSFIKYDDFWQFITLDFDTKPDNVGLH